MTKIIRYDDRFMAEVLAFRPDVMLMFPMTSVTLAVPYHVFKHLFGTRDFCFRAEGIVDPNSPSSLSNHIEYDRYGATLVDGDIYWGPGSAKLIGDALVARGKLSSPERVRCFGYPRIVRYFGIPPAATAVEPPQSLASRLVASEGCRTVRTRFV